MLIFLKKFFYSHLTGMCLASILVLLVITFAGCRHTSPFIEQPYFEALGGEGEVVFTIDVKKAKAVDSIKLFEQESLLGFAPLLKRSDRLSISIEGNEYTQTSSKSFFSGALEGDFSKFIVNSALLFGSDWIKNKDYNVPYWDNKTNGLKVYIPENGIILFSQDDMLNHIEKTLTNRVVVVPENAAISMNKGLAGIYIQSPERLDFLQDFLPVSVIINLETLWASLSKEFGDYTLTGELVTTSPQAARTMAIVLRLTYQNSIKNNNKLYLDWKDDIEVDGNVIIFNDMYIEELKVAQAVSSISTKVINN